MCNLGERGVVVEVLTRYGISRQACNLKSVWDPVPLKHLGKANATHALFLNAHAHTHARPCKGEGSSCEPVD